MSIKSWIKDFFAGIEAKKSICAKCRFRDDNDPEDLCRHPKRETKTKDYISGKIRISYYSCESYNMNGECYLFSKKPTITKIGETK